MSQHLVSQYQYIVVEFSYAVFVQPLHNTGYFTIDRLGTLFGRLLGIAAL